MATLLDELSQLISALNENGVEYAVCGGLALAIHGFVRTSRGWKMKKVDMSSEAITRRLRQVDQLRELCLSLRRAKKESDEKKKREKNPKTENPL